MPSVPAETGNANKNPIPRPFPASWTGNWQGQLHVLRGSDTLQRVDMRLAITALDSGAYTWALGYGPAASDERPYVLTPQDSTGTHWQIDERNGIVLDAYRHGDVFYSCFEVMGTLLFTRDELRGDTLYHEILSGPFRATVTGDTVLPNARRGSQSKGDTIPAVASYPLRNSQTARLTRG